MKKFVKFISVILSLMLIITACGSTPESADSTQSLKDSIVGTWRLIEVNGQKPKYLDRTEFYSDGTFINLDESEDSARRKGTYTFSASTLLMSIPWYEERRFACSISGDTMTWEYKGNDQYTCVYERVNE